MDQMWDVKQREGSRASPRSGVHRGSVQTVQWEGKQNRQGGSRSIYLLFISPSAFLISLMPSPRKSVLGKGWSPQAVIKLWALSWTKQVIFHFLENTFLPSEKTNNPLVLLMEGCTWERFLNGISEIVNRQQGLPRSLGSDCVTSVSCNTN